MHLSPEFKSLCSDVLVEGVEELSLSDGVYLAIISHVESDQYEIVSVHSTSNVFVAGESYPLNDTLCREVIEKRKTIALTRIEKKPNQSLHPLYDNMGIEAYISTPLYHGDEIWGTLNFSNLRIERQPFREHEIDFIEEKAKLISEKISG